MDTENDKSANVSTGLRNLRIQMLDYLFERGHRVSKPLIDAAAQFTFEYGQALYEQGKNAGHAAQFAKDQAEGVEAITDDSANEEPAVH